MSKLSFCTFCLIKSLNRFPMCLKKFLWLVILLSAFRTIQGSPIKRGTTTVFNLNSTVRINGTDLSELACTGYDQLASRLCSTITEVTCQQLQLGRIKPCTVSNQDSIFFNTPVVNETIIHNKIVNGKRLIFSPNKTLLVTVSQIQTIGQLSLSPKEQTEKTEEEKAIRRNRIWVFTCLPFAFVMGLLIVYFLVKKYCYGYSPFAGWEEANCFGGSVVYSKNTMSYSSETAATSYR